MGDIKNQKERTVKCIERLSTLFAIVAVVPALRALELRTKLQPHPMPDSRLLHDDHAIQQIAQELGDRIGIKVQTELVDAHKPLYNAFTYATGRKNNIGKITEVRIVFMGTPLQTPAPELITRSIIGHELGHVEQMNSNFFTCNRANMQISILMTLMSMGASALQPAYLPIAAAGAAITFLITALNQWEERCNEFLADFRGAEIIGSTEDMARTLAYTHDMSMNQFEEIKDGKKPSVISRIFNHNAFSGHPPIEKRVEALLHYRPKPKP